MAMHFECVFFKLVIITCGTKGGAKLLPGEKQFILIITPAAANKNKSKKCSLFAFNPRPQLKGSLSGEILIFQRRLLITPLSCGAIRAFRGHFWVRNRWCGWVSTNCLYGTARLFAFIAPSGLASLVECLCCTLQFIPRQCSPNAHDFTLSIPTPRERLSFDAIKVLWAMNCICKITLFKISTAKGWENYEKLRTSFRVFIKTRIWA